MAQFDASRHKDYNGDYHTNNKRCRSSNYTQPAYPNDHRSRSVHPDFQDDDSLYQLPIEVVNLDTGNANDNINSQACINAKPHPRVARTETLEYSPPPAGARILLSPTQPCYSASPTCSRDQPQEEPYSSITRYVITKPLALTSPFDLLAPTGSATADHFMDYNKPGEPAKSPRKKIRNVTLGPSPAPPTPSSETSSATAQRCTILTRRKRAALAALLRRERGLRAEEAALDAYYARHGVDVVKVESCSSKSIYLPWDRGQCAVLDQHGVEKLADNGIGFWAEEGEEETGVERDWWDWVTRMRTLRAISRSALGDRHLAGRVNMG